MDWMVQVCTGEVVYVNQNDESREKLEMKGCVNISGGVVALSLQGTAYYSPVGNPFWSLEEGVNTLFYESQLYRHEGGSWIRVGGRVVGSNTFTSGFTFDIATADNVTTPGTYRFDYSGNKTGGYWCETYGDNQPLREVHCGSTAGLNRDEVYDIVSFSGNVEFAVGE
ncbi:hypothetical protein ACFP1Z_28890 [Streptomyces gamaensis]|uniref:Uncharacterized protein n=1 Tax=Streptomyces gamaensis TaxID=1763542 RepID=A0ABW0Z8D2_9ACTN